MGENLGRYSFIGLDSLRNIKVLADQIIVEEGGRSQKIPIGTRNPLEILRELMAPLALRHDSLPGLVGGAVGYIGYDFVRFLERLPSRLPDPLGLPLCNFYLASTMVIFDHVKHKMLLVTVAAEDPQAKLDEVFEQLRQPLAPGVDGPPEGPGAGPVRPRIPRGGIQGGGPQGQGVHPDRGHLPGRPLPAGLRRDPCRPLPGLSRAPDPESLALHVLPRLRRLPAGGIVARDPCEAHRLARPSSGPSPARAGAGRPPRRTIASSGSCSPTRRSGPST